MVPLNTVWLFLIVLGCVTAIITGNVENMMASVMEGAYEAVQLAIGLAGVYCLWSGIEKLAGESGLVDKLASFSGPALRKIFPNLKSRGRALGTISAAVVSNMLGLSSATPLGLKAMNDIKQEAKNKNDCMDSMIRLVVLGAGGFCLFPSTVIALRAALGSKSPALVVGPTAIAGLAATIGGLCAHKVLSRRYFK